MLLIDDCNYLVCENWCVDKDLNFILCFAIMTASVLKMEKLC
jgi:hypothetical protein